MVERHVRWCAQLSLTEVVNSNCCQFGHGIVPYKGYVDLNKVYHSGVGEDKNYTLRIDTLLRFLGKDVDQNFRLRRHNQ